MMHKLQVYTIYALTHQQETSKEKVVSLTKMSVSVNATDIYKVQKANRFSPLADGMKIC